MADDSPTWAAGPAVEINSEPSQPTWAAGPAVTISAAKPSLSEALQSGYDNPTMGEEAPIGTPGANVIKDLGLGAAENVTGIGELIPGLSPYAAKGTKYLHSKVDYPVVEEVGSLAPWMFGGEVLGGAKIAGSLIPKVAEGAGFLTRAATDMGRGMISGGVSGAEAGMAMPTGKEDYGEAMKEKGLASAAAIPAGVLLGGGLGLGGEAVRTLGKTFGNVSGEKAREAAEALRAGTAGKAGAEASSAGAKAVDLENEQSRVSGALDKATAEAEDANKAVDTAKANADKLIEDFRQSPAQDAVSFGDKVRTLASKTYQQRINARTRVSDIKGAKAAAGEGAIVPTDNISSYLSQWEKETTDPNEQSIIAYVRNALGGDTPGPLNIEKAESTRTTLASLERAKDLSAIGKSDGKSAKAGYRVGQVLNLLKDSISKSAPEVSKAVDRFKQMSRPLDPFERRGPLAGAVKTDALSDDYITEQGKLVESLLSRTKDGSSPFEVLIQEDPKLKEDMRQYLQFKLFGKANLPRDVTPEKVDAFVRDNERVLRQTGLLRDFVGIRNKVSAATDAVERLKLTANAQQGNVKAIQDALSETQKAGKISTEAEKKYGDMVQKISDPKITKTQDVAKETARVVEAMRGDNLLSRDQWMDALKQIGEVNQKYTDAAEARKALLKIAGMLVLYGAGYQTYREIRAHL